MDVECIKIKRGKVLSNIRLVNIPTGFFVVEFGGTCVLVVELERGGGQFPWGDGPSQGHGECATHSGKRETQELTRYQGKNGFQWNGEGAWERRGSFRISRPEEVIQRNRSFPSGLGGMILSHDG